MTHLEIIKNALKDRNLFAVAHGTGLNVHTLYRLVNGKSNPSKTTIRILSDYLRLGDKNDQA
jgi:DNA-binding phage protein